MWHYRLGVKTSTHFVYITGFSMLSSGCFMSPAAAVWSPKAFTFPLLPGTRLRLALEWCIPANGPPKYSLWDRGNSQVYVRDIQRHTHTAAFCRCEFMGWGNDKNSTQRAALWSPLRSLATSGITVNNWAAAIEGRRGNAEEECERAGEEGLYAFIFGLWKVLITHRVIFVFFFSGCCLWLCIFVTVLYVLAFLFCNVFMVDWCFISVLPKSHPSVTDKSVLWLLSLFNHRAFQMFYISYYKFYRAFSHISCSSSVDEVAI